MAFRMPSQSFRMSGPSSQAWNPNGRPSGFADMPAVRAAAAAAATSVRNSRRVTLTVPPVKFKGGTGRQLLDKAKALCHPAKLRSTKLARRRHIANRGVAETLAKLRQIQAARRHMPVERF